MSMQITVVVCTFNRSSLLPAALESMAASEMPADIGWDILVVDNNSNDNTAAVVERFMCRYPGRFQYLFEPRPGKSNALNSGIAHARGDVLAFADDDVTVHSDWLYNLTRPLLTEDWSGCGGRVLAQWDSAFPSWLDPKSWIVAGPLVQFDRGLQPGPLNETPMGTNMAFKKLVFERYGQFRTDLGPSPGSEIRNEDSEFTRRLLNAGEPLYYQPEALVYHPVPEGRLSRSYFLAWWFDKARSEIREAGISTKRMWGIWGIPFPTLRRLLRWTTQWMLTLDVRKRFVCKIRVWKLAGEIAERRSLSVI